LETSDVPAYAQLLVILVVMVGFWAIVMRPARNQQRKVQQLQRELEVGQDVVLSAGIFGTIRSLTETRAEIEVAPGTVLTVARQVVVRRAEDLEETPGPGTDPDVRLDHTEPTDPSEPTGRTGAED
jgi:preprotein translocase subunit YajC